MSVMPWSQERILGWPYLRLYQKCLSRLAEYDDVIRGPPFLVLPRAPLTLIASGPPNPRAPKGLVWHSAICACTEQHCTYQTRCEN